MLEITKCFDKETSISVVVEQKLMVSEMTSCGEH